MNWEKKDDALKKRFSFSDFESAMDFVYKVANIAKSRDHHPGISINYDKVVLELTTHEEGGVTQKDHDMAKEIDSLITAADGISPDEAINMDLLEGMIFDMDGVIIDSIPLHKRSYSEIFDKHGIPFTIKRFDEINGMNIQDAFEYIRKEGGEFDVEKAVEAKKKANIEIARNAPMVEGMGPVLEKLKYKYRFVLATSATEPEARIVKQRFRIEPDCTVTGDDVEKSKPHPEIFKKCAQALNLNEKTCMVIEDAPRGIEAAKRAGMPVIAITTTHDREQLKSADYIIDDAKEILDIIGG